MRRYGSSGLLIMAGWFAFLEIGRAETRYVSLAGGHVPPFTNWANAATNIQAAIDAASDGDTALVSNGVYATGGRVVYGAMVNRVAITKPVTVRSVNGPNVTVIRGLEAAGGGNGKGAIRCVYMVDGAVLAGFTLIQGYTRLDGDWHRERSGGGVWCESASAVLSNCTLTGNSAAAHGGGAYGGALYNCMLTENSASYGGGSYGVTLNHSMLTGNSADWGGGSRSSTLRHCALSDNSAAYGGGASDSILYDCELTGNSADNNGGGTYGSTLNNCTLTGNSANNGGGASFDTLYNCMLTVNSAIYGGGAFQSTLYNCTLTVNSAIYGGGLYGGALYHCIVFYNTARSGANWENASLTNTCTTPLPEGSDNFTNEPVIVSVNNPHLLAGSPCIDAGMNQSWMTNTTDMDGEPRINGVVDFGADEFWSGSLTGALSAAILTYSQAIFGFTLSFKAEITGRAQGYVWDFGDGTRVTNRFDVAHVYGTCGDFPVTLSVSNLTGSMVAAVTAHVVEIANYYVTTNGDDKAAGTNWVTAKATIQAAIDAAIPGAIVWVSNGVYATGGKANYPMGSTLTNRVAIYKPITVRSVRGPTETIIMGNGPAGDAAVRCVYLTVGARLTGFTLTNGYTHSWTYEGNEMEWWGGGLWGESVEAVISNCVIAGNVAYANGGGAAGGAFYNCRFLNNSGGYGGGTCWGALYTCMLAGNSADIDGGGTYESTLYACLLTSNSTVWGNGGGTAGSTLYDCALTGNFTGGSGGGTVDSAFYDCALTGNFTDGSGGGGGTAGGKLYHCTLSNNSAFCGGGASGGALNNFRLISNFASGRRGWST